MQTERGDHVLRTRSLTAIMGFAATLCSALVGLAIGGPSASHVVAVMVLARNEIAINEGKIALTMSDAYAGRGWRRQWDDGVCRLRWTAMGTDKKITVSTDQVSRDYTLKVVAQNVSSGAAAAEVMLDDIDAHDFVTGIAWTTGGCDLKYTCSATSPAGQGIGIHTVTYTFTDVF